MIKRKRPSIDELEPIDMSTEPIKDLKKKPGPIKRKKPPIVRPVVPPIEK